MSKAGAAEALKLREHAIRCLDYDNPSWSYLLTIGEQILFERGIRVR
jgi:hypothetical protein